MVTLCIPTLKRYDTLTACLESARDSSVKPDCVCIMDNGRALPAAQLALYREWFDSVMYIVPKTNLGCAKSWNFFLSMFPDPVIICNDDIQFHKTTIEDLVAASEQQPDAQFFYAQANTGHDNSWSCFLQRVGTLTTIGSYDEEFYPAYFEDNDYSWRLVCNGTPPVKVNTLFEHVGSATLAAYTPEELALHHHNFRLNEQYYIQKWGG